jgi:hypothetical protein
MTTTDIQLIVSVFSLMAILVTIGIAFGTLRSEIREVQRRQDLTNGRLLADEKRGARQGERISHLEGRSQD